MIHFTCRFRRSRLLKGIVYFKCGLLSGIKDSFLLIFFFFYIGTCPPCQCPVTHAIFFTKSLHIGKARKIGFRCYAWARPEKRDLDALFGLCKYFAIVRQTSSKLHFAWFIHHYSQSISFKNVMTGLDKYVSCRWALKMDIKLWSESNRYFALLFLSVFEDTLQLSNRTMRDGVETCLNDNNVWNEFVMFLYILTQLRREQYYTCVFFPLSTVFSTNWSHTHNLEKLL